VIGLPLFEGGLIKIFPGGDLLSRGLTPRVPSALEGLTTVFGMGTGVAPPLYPPERAEVGGRKLEAGFLNLFILLL
jgi:hypothetical protein